METIDFNEIVRNNWGTYLNGEKIDISNGVLDRYNRHRFWNKVDIKANNSVCWPWLGAVNKSGYGIFGFNGSSRLSHRIAFFFFYGVEPNDMCVLHKCDNPKCCNPHHLFLGTKKDNSDDKFKKGRSASFKGESNGACKLTNNDVINIREQRRCGVSTKELSKRYGVCRTAIYHVCNGKTWAHINEMSK